MKSQAYPLETALELVDYVDPGLKVLEKGEQYFFVSQEEWEFGSAMELADFYSSHVQFLPDDLNPEFIFRLTDTRLLSKAVQGTIDLVKLAKKELESRAGNYNEMS